MGELDFVGVDAIVAHQKPARQSMIDLMIGVAKGGKGYLGGECLDELGEQRGEHRIARQSAQQRRKRYAKSISRDLHENFMDAYMATDAGRRRSEALAAKHACLRALTFSRRRDHRANTAAQEIDMLDDLVCLGDDRAAGKIHGLQIIEEVVKFGLWQKRKKAVAQTGMFWCVHGSR